MSSAAPASPRRHLSQPLRQQHLGAIIDARGREIPITEQMILQACRQLEQADKQRRRFLFG